MKKHSFDLLIIGGGILGTFHAYQAINLGLKVALIEKNSTPQGSTVQNFGMVIPSGMNGKWQQYSLTSLNIYKSIQAEHNISVRQNGSIYIASCDDEVQLIEELHAINKTHNYPSQLITPEQCKDRYPSLHPDYCKAGLFFPEEISINPRTMINQVHHYLKQQPMLSLFDHTLVHELYVQGNGEVVAKANDRQQFSASKAIVCSGTEFNLLFPDTYRQSDLVMVKLQMMRLKPQRSIKLPGNILTGLTIRQYDSFRECPSFRTIKEKEGPFTFHKKWDIHLLFKQEEDGSIIAGDSHEYAKAKDADSLGFDLRSDIHAYFLREGRKIVDLEHWNVDATWTGFYSKCSMKDIFQTTIDRNIHIVTGIGGKGMTTGPGFARDNIDKLVG